MLAAPLPARLRVGRFWTGMVSGIGMIIGMAWGASLALALVWARALAQFLVALGGMTLGMLARDVFRLRTGPRHPQNLDRCRGNYSAFCWADLNG